MRVIVTGHRAWDCRDLAAEDVRRLVSKYGQGLVIVHGALGGAVAAFGAAA